MINSETAEGAATAPRNALSTAQSRVPVYRSAAPSSMEVTKAGCIGSGEMGRSGRKMLGRRGGNAHAVAPSHQHAILGPAQIRNIHGEPYSDGGQGDCKGEGCDVRKHAVAKIVRFFPGALIAGQ